MTGFYFSLANFIAVTKVLWTEPRWGMRWYVGIAGTLAVVAGLAAIVARRPRGQSLRAPPERAPARAPRRQRRRCWRWRWRRGRSAARSCAYVPLANYVQFPWRMFLFAGCLAPLCAPAAVDGFFASPRARWLAAAAAIVAVVAVLAPLLRPAGAAGAQPPRRAAVPAQPRDRLRHRR